MPDLGVPTSFAGRATLDGLLRILRDGRHLDGRPLGANLAARLRALAMRMSGAAHG